MKRYKELNLKSLREEADIDFAHFTYLKGMCSCCFPPSSFPKIYIEEKVYQGMI